MSLFSIGGNIGYALGAFVTTSLVVALGLDGALLLLVPALAVGALLGSLTPYLRGFLPEPGSAAARVGENRPGALWLLLSVIAFRSIAWFGLITFVPLWEVSLGHSKSYGNHLLSAMLLAGALGTLVAGPIADRVGLRTVLVVSNVVTPPLIFVFIAVGGVAGAVAVVLVGPFVIGTFSVTMVLSQEYLPRHIGMASGLSIGFSIGLGGVAAVVLGAIADSVDLRTALYVCAAAPIAGVLLTALLPPARPRGHLEPEVAVP
jgi:FSR family fosmidomycin resistance protein-like MFS transporter